jgi:creatinine amidohydrolase
MYSKYDITTAKWGNVSKVKQYHLAILPWGSTEPHNRHLPYCTDMLTVQAIAFEVAEAAAKQGVNAMVLPGIPLGSQNPGQIELPFCIHATQQTQMCVLRDVVNSLKHQGINKLLIMSGHGGNIFKGMIRDLAMEEPSFTICHNEWFAFIPRDGFFEEKDDDHAGEQETSVMLHYYPELVEMKLAGEGKFKRFAIEGLNKKVAWAPRDWSKTTQDTGVGNPKKATAAKGAAYMKVVLPQIVKFVVDFAKKKDFYDK